MSLRGTHRLRVRYAECDPQGQVFNGFFLTYLDTAFDEFLAATLGSYERLEQDSRSYVVAEANLHFLAPAKAHDDLDLAVELDEPGGSSMTANFEIRRMEALLTTAWIRYVCIDTGTNKSAGWPDWFREAIRPYVRTDANPSPDAPKSRSESPTQAKRE